MHHCSGVPCSDKTGPPRSLQPLKTRSHGENRSFLRSRHQRTCPPHIRSFSFLCNGQGDLELSESDANPSLFVAFTLPCPPYSIKSIESWGVYNMAWCRSKNRPGHPAMVGHLPSPSILRCAQCNRAEISTAEELHKDHHRPRFCSYLLLLSAP